jgi:hypothetical protein
MRSMMKQQLGETIAANAARSGKGRAPAHLRRRWPK